MKLILTLIFALTGFAASADSPGVCEDLAIGVVDKVFATEYPDQVETAIHVKVTYLGDLDGSSYYRIQKTVGQQPNFEWGVEYRIGVFVNHAMGQCTLDNLSSRLIAE